MDYGKDVNERPINDRQDRQSPFQASFRWIFQALEIARLQFK
jgi:hypothetical protein